MTTRPLEQLMRSQIVGPILAYLRDAGADASRLIERFDLSATDPQA